MTTSYWIPDIKLVFQSVLSLHVPRRIFIAQMRPGAHVAPAFTILLELSAGIFLWDGMPNLRNVFAAFAARPSVPSYT